MINVTPKPLPKMNLPKLNQVRQPLRRVDASSLREYGRESSLVGRILVFGELSKDGVS